MRNSCASGNTQWSSPCTGSLTLSPFGWIPIAIQSEPDRDPIGVKVNRIAVGFRPNFNRNLVELRASATRPLAPAKQRDFNRNPVEIRPLSGRARSPVGIPLFCERQRSRRWLPQSGRHPTGLRVRPDCNRIPVWSQPESDEITVATHLDRTTPASPKIQRLAIVSSVIDAEEIDHRLSLKFSGVHELHSVRCA